MRWIEQRLHTKFAAGTAAGLLVSSLVFLVLFFGLYRDQLERERADAASQITRLLQTSLEKSCLVPTMSPARAIEPSATSRVAIAIFPAGLIAASSLRIPTPTALGERGRYQY